jgi:hypothetical protein
VVYFDFSRNFVAGVSTGLLIINDCSIAVGVENHTNFGYAASLAT